MRKEKINIGPLDVIFLFELGQTNPASSGFDLQESHSARHLPQIMKTTLRPPLPLCRKAKSLILLVLLSTPSRGAEPEESGAVRPPEGVPFRDVITTEKLGEAFRQIRLEDPAAKFEPATSEDPSERCQTQRHR